MDFRLELKVKPLSPRISIHENVLLTGSCFTDHMSSRLRELKFRVMENPNGIVFNPLSIEKAVLSWISQKSYDEQDLFYHQEQWQSWHFHGHYASMEASESLERMNKSVQQAHQFLKNAQWLVITLGSAFVYSLVNDSLGGSPGQVVANCHKVPASHFHHRLASLAEVEASLSRTISAVAAFNPNCQVLFTISPVRHYREGLVENNRSKGILHNAVHTMLQQYDHVQYFPAYELVIDDLRDYRFYAEDLVHPNYAATQYVWEKFEASCLDEETRQLIPQLQDLLRAYRHKPFSPRSAQHKKFLCTYAQKAVALQDACPFLDLKEIIAFFQASGED